MTRQPIFLSNLQKEFAAEWLALRDFLQGDPLLRRFFVPGLFEDLPAIDRRADELYLDLVDRSALYVGLFGSEYGSVDAEGISLTEREFQRAGERSKPRLIFLKAADDTSRDPRMLALIRQAEAFLLRGRFVTTAKLIAGLYAALVQWLDDHQLIRSGPFDASPCPNASLADLDADRIAWFIERARQVRGFPLPPNASLTELFTIFNRLDHGQPVDVVLARLDFAVGTRVASSQCPSRL